MHAGRLAQGRVAAQAWWLPLARNPPYGLGVNTNAKDVAMPVAIDHVESEVVVEGGRGHDSAETSHRTLTEPQPQQRWRTMQRQAQWDHERTSAVDYDHAD